jgi:hypothetical protein
MDRRHEIVERQGGTQQRGEEARSAVEQDRGQNDGREKQQERQGYLLTEDPVPEGEGEQDQHGRAQPPERG